MAKARELRRRQWGCLLGAVGLASVAPAIALLAQGAKALGLPAELAADEKRRRRERDLRKLLRRRKP